MLANILFPQGCELEIAQIGLNGVGITIVYDILKVVLPHFM